MMFKHCLVSILTLVWIPAAQADTMVWFETLNTNGQFPTNEPGGGPGAVLNLFCNPFLPEPCTWQISMRAAVGAGLYNWSLNLLTAPGNGVTVSNPQIQPGPFNIQTSPGATGSGVSLLQNAHGVALQPPLPQTVTLMTFSLTRSIQFGDLSLATIFGGPSSDPVWGDWINESGNFEVVQFGLNPAAPGVGGTIGSLHLIWIGSPEPNTLSLLMFGAIVCLLRRSRLRGE